MKKIRQNNDIDITVYIKDRDTGKYLDPTSCSDISIRLQTASKKVPITDFVLSSEGHIDFRFHAKDQTRIGVYTIVISATTDDGRVFTTDVCDAFALVACSCESGGESEIKVETLDLTAEFAITAWGGADKERIEALEKGKQDNIEDLEKIREGAKLGATALQEYYDDGSHEVVPVKHPDLSTQPSILPYKFNGNYVYEQMVYVDLGEFYGTWSKDILELPDDFLILELVGQIQKGDETAILSLIGGPNLSDMNLLIDNKSIVFTGSVDNGANPVPVNAWFRVVWTTKPKDEYYYQQGGNEVTLTLDAWSADHIKEFKMDFSGNTVTYENSIKPIIIIESLLREFLEGRTPIEAIRGTNYTGTVAFNNDSTGEFGDMFVHPEDTFTVYDLEELAPQTLYNLMNGVPQTLHLYHK